MKNLAQTHLLVLEIVVSCSGLFSSVSAYELSTQWQIDDAFTMPESAVIDAVGESIYVSNVNTYALDNNGFISRVSISGTLLDLEWITGLHSPTGMAVHGRRLYVADVDSLVEIDIETATIRNRFPAPDQNPVLNDVAISTTGEVYVSGSASRSIYLLGSEGLTVWLKDDVLLQQANGLYVERDSLVHGGRLWNVFDRQTAALLPDQVEPQPALYDIDGITRDGCDGYLVTLIDDGRIWRVRGDGSSAPVAETVFDGIDLHFLEGSLALPQVGGGLSLLRVNSDNCESD